MKTGTKSLLFGVHNFLWHPITVWLAWKKLYGKTPSFKETICVVIHDWGYWGCEHMDDEQGENHPVLASKIAARLFKNEPYYAELCLLHSRHLARNLNSPPSKLCWADKYSILYDPKWFYLWRAKLSGELKEYRKESAACGFCSLESSNAHWFNLMRAFMRDQAVAQKSSNIYMRYRQE